MTGVQVPSDPAPNGYIQNPYTAELDAALAYLRAERDNKDGWQHIGIEDGIEMETKSDPNDSSVFPVIRVHGTVPDVTPSALLSTIRQTSTRHHWDVHFESGGVLERYSRWSSKFYSVLKGDGRQLSPRDFVGVEGTFFLGGENSGGESGFEFVQTSVPGDQENPGRVRSTLGCAGWSVVPHDGHMRITHIVKVDPNGPIPDKAISKFVKDTAAVITKIIELIQRVGSPPFVVENSITSQIRSEEFDLEGKRHTIKGIAGDKDEDFLIEIGQKTFGANWSIQAAGSATAKKKSMVGEVHVTGKGGQFELRVSAA